MQCCMINDIRWEIDKNEFNKTVLFNAYKHVLEVGTYRALFAESRTVLIRKKTLFAEMHLIQTDDW